MPAEWTKNTVIEDVTYQHQAAQQTIAKAAADFKENALSALTYGRMPEIAAEAHVVECIYRALTAAVPMSEALETLDRNADYAMRDHLGSTGDAVHETVKKQVAYYWYRRWSASTGGFRTRVRSAIANDDAAAC